MWLTETLDQEMYENLNLTQLNLDEYYIRFNVPIGIDRDFYLYSRHEDCEDCLYAVNRLLDTNIYYKQTRKYNEEWAILNISRGTIAPPYINSNNPVTCKYFPDVGEFGVYQFNIWPNNVPCELTTFMEPVNIYAGILTVLFVSTALGILGLGIKYVYNHIIKPRLTMFDSKIESKQQLTTLNKRLRSLDAFRGLCVMFMVFINFGGGFYQTFQYSPWNGLTIADLIFPFFLWIVGFSIPLSYTSELQKESSYYNLMCKILKRSITLFLCGMATPEPYLLTPVSVTLQTVRIFGVLQRISICYVVVSLLMLMPWHKQYTKQSLLQQHIFDDILELIPQWIIIFIIMLIHLLLIFLLTVPNCEKGYLGPGGIHKENVYAFCTGGASNHIDRTILGTDHVSVFPSNTFEIYLKNGRLYNSAITLDPQGFFGTFNAVIQVFIGTQAAITYISFNSHAQRIIRWIIWAVVTGLLGGILCLFSKNDGYIPINRNIWSLSFVFVTSCLAFVIFVFHYVMIDTKKIWTGAPLYFLGLNSFIIYMGHIFLRNSFPFFWQLEVMNTHYLFLALAVWATFLWSFVAYMMFLKNLFITV